MGHCEVQCGDTGRVPEGQRGRSWVEAVVHGDFQPAPGGSWLAALQGAGARRREAAELPLLERPGIAGQPCRWLLPGFCAAACPRPGAGSSEPTHLLSLAEEGLHLPLSRPLVLPPAQHLLSLDSVPAGGLG